MSRKRVCDGCAVEHVETKKTKQTFGHWGRFQPHEYNDELHLCPDCAAKVQEFMKTLKK